MGLTSDHRFFIQLMDGSANDDINNPPLPLGYLLDPAIFDGDRSALFALDVPFFAGGTKMTPTHITFGTLQDLHAALDHAPLSAVPEPAAWTMMIGGLGLIGGLLRSRRKTNWVTA